MILTPQTPENNKHTKTTPQSFFNILDHTKNIQSRSDIETLPAEYQKSNIILPRFFYDATIQLANQPKEHRGVLLATKEQRDGKDFYIVKYMKILGSGTATSVYLDSKKLEAIQKLITNHSELKAIEFHVHTKDTGKYREDKFSGGDYYAIEKALINNIEYIHVLFTPTHVLTLAKQKTNFALTKEQNKDVANILEEGFKNLDHEFDTLLIK